MELIGTKWNCLAQTCHNLPKPVKFDFVSLYVCNKETYNGKYYQIRQLAC